MSDFKMRHLLWGFVISFIITSKECFAENCSSVNCTTYDIPENNTTCFVLKSEISCLKNKKIDNATLEEIVASIQPITDAKICNKIIDDKDGTDNTKEDWTVWVWSLGTVTCINILSLVIVLFLPNKKNRAYPYVMTLMVSLGISVLLCDAVFHLLPHALGLHGDEDEHDENHEEGHGGIEQLLLPDEHTLSPEHIDRARATLWRSMVMVASIFFFFSFDMILSVSRKYHHEQEHANSPDECDLSFWHGCPTTKAHKEGECDISDILMSNMEKNARRNEQLKQVKTRPRKVTLADIKSLKTIVLMTQIGDTLHNFIDGVAIGLAFSRGHHRSQGNHGGISTGVAVFLHELPHELTDFAVLKAAGLSPKSAVMMNFASSCSAYVGVILGVLVASVWEDAITWAFAFTAGLFIYIALVTMLIQLTKMPMLEMKPKTIVLLELIGLAVGFVLMFLLSAYGEQALS